MLKVLIADDEIKVCQLIRYLIDWESLGMEIISCVHDGLSAFNLIKEKNPDIVITDIRMPEYDGIELIKNAKILNPNIHFIIISGFSHFEYAHNAIKYGVEDYLLKPLKKKELLETLNKLSLKHNEKLLDVTERENLQHQISNSNERIKRNMLNELLAKPENIEVILEKDNINNEYSLNFKKGNYLVIIVKTGMNLEIHDENNRAYDLLMEKSEVITNEILSLFCDEIITTIAKEGVICIINGNEENIKGLKRQLTKIRNEIIGLKDVFDRIKVTIGVSTCVEDINHIETCITEAKTAVLQGLILSENHLIEYENIVLSNAYVADMIDTQLRNQILKNVELFDLDGFSNSMNEVVKRISHCNNLDGWLIFKVYKEIVDIYLFGMKNTELGNESIFQRDVLVRKFYLFFSMEEIFSYITGIIIRNMQNLLERKKQEDMKPIRIAKQYISKNYCNPLTLEDVSNQIGFNSSYFSSLFKKETGQSFTEYLAEVRIENAKYMLIESDLNIVDIGEKVGYTDMKYFSKLFKKITGLNPKEYRKLYN